MALGLGMPSIGPGRGGPLLGTFGSMSYKEVASLCSTETPEAVYVAGGCNDVWSGVGDVFLDAARGQQVRAAFLVLACPHALAARVGCYRCNQS